MEQIYYIFFTALLLLFFPACSDSTSQENDIQTKTETIALAGNTFLTSGNSGMVSQNGISGWTDPDAVFTVFVKLSEPALTEVKLRANSANSSSISVEINGQNRTEQITSEQNPVSFGEFELPGGEYIQIDLRGVEKEGTEFAEASELILELPVEINASYVKDNENGRYYWGRRGPSVHLSYETPEETDLKWFYSEVTVPENEDPPGSFYMANGFGEGYFGIQVNSETERRVLFSVWSPYQTDNPEEIPEEKRIQLLDSGEDVNVGEFGNEGSGGQSFLRYDWSAETTYRFLNSVEPDGSGNSIYTAYFYSPDEQEWRLIARFLRPETDTWYTRPHSFLESFLTRNGHLSREALYHNQWAMDTSGIWHELTHATFTGDDIAQTGYRLDFDGGLQGDLFFMRNGGFFVGETSLGSEFTRNESGRKPDVNPDELP
ncbi:MAG: DUF3472 domain-containing protein [Balneolaceae bacterium]|nr:DUF3472 domain-containing protein [Balneolaceae bacterium]